jgi:hypothetical protein
VEEKVKIMGKTKEQITLQKHIAVKCQPAASSAA